MSTLTLVIGNKNYSSWSLRPWFALRRAGIPFAEVRIPLSMPQTRERILEYSPSAKVPLLVDGATKVWESLAILEYLAEKYPQQCGWPADPAARALARSASAEMHAGFAALRGACPMNIEATLPEVGARVLAEQAAVCADLDRIVAMWSAALDASGGPFLFGGFGNADAYYAPVVARIRCYALPLPPALAAYTDRVWANPAVAAWVSDALAERDFLDFEEPYRSART